MTLAKIPGLDWQKAWRAVFTAQNIPAALALAVIIGSGVFADWQNTQFYRERLRNDVLNQMSVVRAKLEGHINGNLQLVRGLIGVLAAEPKMNQQRFAQLAANIFEEESQLRNIAAAPNMVVQLMYPLRGNEKAIGLDYRSDPKQSPAAIRAMETGQMVLAGPVNLVQGGQGLIGRFPVYLTQPRGRHIFWGLVSSVIDLDRLYVESGLFDSQLGIEIAIAGQDGTGSAGKQFYGDPAIFDDDPVSGTVVLPSGSWLIAAVPRGGWNAEPDNALILRTLIVGCGILVFFPILVAGRLVTERQRNIKQLRDREHELETLSRRLGLALDASQVGVWAYDLVTKELVWDGRMNELYGYPADGATRGYEHWAKALHPDDLDRASREFSQAFESGSYHSEYRIVTRAGETRHIRAIGKVYRDAGANTKIIGVNWDVSADRALNAALVAEKQLTEMRNAELEATRARIEHNALHDSLTGLPNRRYLDETLRAHAVHAATDGGGVALLHIDLDRFKQINDTLGHAAGDAMLVHAAEILKSNIRADDFVARIGGDEFVVLCQVDDSTAHLTSLADRIIERMRQPVAYLGHECRFGVSIGIATDEGFSIDPKRLMINADIALYRAKDRGRNRYEFFTAALQSEVVRTKRIADDILSGLEKEGQFIPYYQPQFDAKTLDVVGVEALARWQHPREGLLGPDAFLKTAEELSVLATIDRLILEQTLVDRARWAEAGIVVPRASVNVSSRRLHDEDLIAGLKQLAIPPGTISFELVESIYLDESDEIVGWNIDQIKELGFDIEIDDFGTGYASIVSLLKLKPRRLKIDRQLVMPITKSAAQLHLVESIVEIGKSLGIEVVAEGVETMQHARVLREIGCDILQGYAFSRPLSAKDLQQLLAAQAWREPAKAG